MLEIPTGIDAVTPDWLTQVLRSADVITTSSVVGFDREQVGAGVGIMGELHRLTLRYDGTERSAPATVIVKLPSPYESNRSQGVSLGVYEAEVGFYRELATGSAIRTPTCWFAEIIAGTADFALVMEDLGSLVMADQIDGMTPDQVEQAVAALADLHVGWWGAVQTPEYNWIPSVVHERIKAMAEAWPQLWPVFAAKFGDSLPPGALKAGERISTAYWALMVELGRRPWTVLHQDFRSENLFFDPAKHEVVAFDWQSLGRGPGAYDLAYLLGGSITIEDRRQHEDQLVRAYHARLITAGVEGYGLDDLWHDYRIGMMVNTSTPVLVGATMDLANERGLTLIRTMAERHFAGVVDLDATDLIP